MPKWTMSHTFIVIVGCVMAILGYLARDPQFSSWAGPALSMLTAVIGYLGLSTGKAFGGRPPVGPAIVLVAAAFAFGVTACPKGSTVPPTVIDVGSCVLDVVSKDMLAGMPLEAALEDAALKCLGSPSTDNVAIARAKWIEAVAAVDRVRSIDGGGR